MEKKSLVLHAAYLLGALFAYSCLYRNSTTLHAQYVQEREWRPKESLEDFNLAAEESLPEPLKRLNSTIILQILQKHCNWSASPKELSADFITTQKLIEGFALHCANSALPYASVDVWYHQADVRIISGTPVKVARAQLHEKCNTNTERACIIFLATSEILNDTLGCSLLLEMLERPFVLITADNRDDCVPFPTYPASASSPEADFLMASPLLIRWYSKTAKIRRLLIHISLAQLSSLYNAQKNMCIRVQHSGHKLLPLPLGPKWQWHSTDFDGENKSETKAHIIEAASPLFLEAHKEKVLYVAMTVESTDNPAYRPNKNLRRSFISHLTANEWMKNATGEDYFSVLHQSGTDHANYMQTVADSMFVLSPPGNGLDTHRTWEALALGSIPIVMTSPLDILFEDLPVVIIQDVKELTQENLQRWYRWFNEPTNLRRYTWEKVTAFWWLQRIIEDTRLPYQSCDGGWGLQSNFQIYLIDDQSSSAFVLGTEKLQ